MCVRDDVVGPGDILYLSTKSYSTTSKGSETGITLSPTGTVACILRTP